MKTKSVFVGDVGYQASGSDSNCSLRPNGKLSLILRMIFLLGTALASSSRTSVDTYHGAENVDGQTELAPEFAKDPATREQVAAEEDDPR